MDPWIDKGIAIEYCFLLSHIIISYPTNTLYIHTCMHVSIYTGTNSLIEVQRKAQSEKNVVLDLDAFNDVTHFESNVVDNYNRRKQSKRNLMDDGSSSSSSGGGGVGGGGVKKKDEEDRVIDRGLERTKPSYAAATHRSNASSTSKVAPSHHHDSNSNSLHAHSIDQYDPIYMHSDDLQGGSEADDNSSYDGGQHHQQQQHPSKKQHKKKAKKEKTVLPPIKLVGSPKAVVGKYHFEDEDYVYPDP